MKNIISLPILLLSISSCSTLGDKEGDILKQAGMKDARRISSEVHLEYLQCYALGDYQKEKCQKDISQKHDLFAEYKSWQYRISYIHEAEKLGFKKFLNDNGKKCNQVTSGPIFSADIRGYSVKCDDGNNYKMKYAYKASEWKIL